MLHQVKSCATVVMRWNQRKATFEESETERYVRREMLAVIPTHQ